MSDTFDRIRELDYVKNVKTTSEGIKIDLFTEPVGDSDVKKIHGDLRSISRKIVNRLNSLKSDGEIKGWRWVEKPEKKYQETSLGRSKISDRKPKGHKPGYYRVYIKD